MRNKRTLSSIAAALTLLPLATPGAGQESRDQYFPKVTFEALTSLDALVAADPAPEPAVDEKEPTVTGKADIRYELLPGGDARFWRSLGITFTWLDQPDRVLSVSPILDDMGNPVVPPMEMINELANPEKRLRQLGITLTPGRWFRSAADFSAAYGLATATTTASYVDADSDPLPIYAGSRPKLDYLAWMGRGSLAKRFAAGLTLTVNVADRTRISGTRALPQFSDDSDATTFTLKFDPDAMVKFAGDVAVAYTALNAHTLLHPDNKAGVKIEQACDLAKAAPVECLNLITGKRVKGRWLAGLLPTVEIKREDQFDFLLMNGAYVRDSRIEGSIETVTLTWDLGTALNSAKHRRDALTAIALHKQLAEQDRMRDKTLDVDAPDELDWSLHGFLYLPIDASYTDADIAPETTWSMHWLDGTTKRSIKELGLTLTPDGTLLGTPWRRGTFELRLRVTDKYANSWPDCGGARPGSCFAPIELEVS